MWLGAVVLVVVALLAGYYYMGVSKPATDSATQTEKSEPKVDNVSVSAGMTVLPAETKKK